MIPHNLDPIKAHGGKSSALSIKIGDTHNARIKEIITFISCPSGPKCEIQHKALPIVFSAG